MELRCSHDIWIGACERCRPISIEHDQAWRNFSYTFKPGHRREIHSKRQFLAECRATGQRWVSKDDVLRRGVPYNPDPTVVDLPKDAVQSAIREAQRSATPANIARHYTRQQKEAVHA